MLRAKSKNYSTRSNSGVGRHCKLWLKQSPNSIHPYIKSHKSYWCHCALLHFLGSCLHFLESIYIEKCAPTLDRVVHFCSHPVLQSILFRKLNCSTFFQHFRFHLTFFTKKRKKNEVQCQKQVGRYLHSVSF